MTAVAILARRPEDGAEEVIGQVSVPSGGGAAVAVGVDAESQAYLDSLLARGVQAADGRMLHLEDGEAFVRALPQAIRGSRLWATRIPRSSRAPSSGSS